MKKTIILVALFILTVFCLSGCKPDKSQSFTYKADGITGIDIETGANSVLMVRNSGSDIEISYPQDVASIRDGILQIDIPMPKAGINLKNPAEVIVSVPDTIFDSIQIKSEAGSVKIENVDTAKLTVETQYGNITLSGMAGRITAKAEMGSIESDLSVASEIKSVGKAGQEVNGQIGTSENEINLYANVGNIELK